jgi:peptidyl-prolyl cis-trans isomerase D
MKAGEISDPVRTQFGWHLIKVEKVNEATITSFDDAKNNIRKILSDNKAKGLAYDDAEAVSDIAYEGEDMIKAAKERHLTILTTDFFSQNGPPKGIKNPSKFASIAFDLSVMEISDIQEFEDGYFILQLLDKIPPQIPEFDKVLEKAKTDLIKKKQEEKAKADATAFFAALKNGKTMIDATTQFHLTPKSTGFFKRSDSIPEIGFERDIAEAAFQLTDENKLPEEILKGVKVYYVIQFKDRKTLESDAFDKEKEDIKKRLFAQKKSRIFDEMLAQIKRRSEISIKEDFLK